MKTLAERLRDLREENHFNSFSDWSYTIAIPGWLYRLLNRHHKADAKRAKLTGVAYRDVGYATIIRLAADKE
jgi:hypothetical protein